jgi:hypothetical protein
MNRDRVHLMASATQTMCGLPIRAGLPVVNRPALASCGACLVKECESDR